jgi:hypothetical protein
MDASLISAAAGNLDKTCAEINRPWEAGGPPLCGASWHHSSKTVIFVLALANTWAARERGRLLYWAKGSMTAAFSTFFVVCPAAIGSGTRRDSAKSGREW